MVSSTMRPGCLWPTPACSPGRLGSTRWRRSWPWSRATPPGWSRTAPAMASDAPGGLLMPAVSLLYRRLARARPAALERIMVRGDPPALAALIGYEYCGYNVAPALALL